MPQECFKSLLSLLKMECQLHRYGWDWYISILPAWHHRMPAELCSRCKIHTARQISTCTLRPSLSRRALAAFISRRQSRASALLSDASTCASRLAASTCPRHATPLLRPSPLLQPLSVHLTLLCLVLLQSQ